MAFIRRFACLLALGLIVVRPLMGAEMQYPIAVAAAEGGPVYVAGRNLPGVWKIADGKLELLFQASKKFRTPLNAVRCLAVDSQGRLYAGDSATREVYRFNEKNEPEALAGGGVGIAMAIDFDKAGDLIVADLEFPGRIVKIPAAGGEPAEITQITAPRGLTVDAQGRIWVVTHGKDRQVVRILTDGKIETFVSGRPFDFPQSITLDAEGNAYVADGYAKAVWKINPQGEPTKLIEGAPLAHPDCVVRQGNLLLVVDPHARKLDAKAGGLFRVTFEGQLTPFEFVSP